MQRRTWPVPQVTEPRADLQVPVEMASIVAKEEIRWVVSLLQLDERFLDLEVLFEMPFEVRSMK